MINTHLTDLLVQKQTFYRPKIAKRSVNRPGSVKTDLIGGTAFSLLFSTTSLCISFSKSFLDVFSIQFINNNVLLSLHSRGKATRDSVKKVNSSAFVISSGN